MRGSAEHDARAQDPFVPRELFHPEIITENDHRLGSLLLFALEEGASEQWRAPQRREEVLAHERRRHRFRPVLSDQRQTIATREREMLERSCFPLVVAEVGIGE